MGAETAAPAVVAVVVACHPGAWFEESLKSFAAQDYAQLSVLVVAVGDDGTTAARVATVLPRAHVAQVPEGTGFAAAANKALGTVSGVAHILICHDDVALAPDAVRLLLEEAYRSNAGLTCPKCVLWDAPDRLLSVGMGADRLGVTHSLVEPGELDQGQHDAVHEVFVAPSGSVLVRTDLWRALGGFDTTSGEPGEDLDISWRAQLAGARVVVAPQAIVRHLEATRNDLRPCPPSERREERREEHRFRALWTCYSALGLLLLTPVVVSFMLAETIWALAHHKSRAEVLLPVSAFLRSFGAPRQLWSARRRAQGMRRANDLALWKYQSRGSARLRALLRRRLEKGHQLAWAASKATTARAAEARASAANRSSGMTAGAVPGPRATAARTTTASGPGGWAAITTNGGGGTNGGQTADLAQNGTVPPVAVVVPGGNGSAPAIGAGERRAEPTGARLSWTWKLGTAALVALLALIGSRGVLSQSLPLVGQLPSTTGGVGEWWHAWWSGAGTGPVGPTSTSPPGLLLMGMVGLLTLGSTNVAVHLLVLGPLLVGPLGVFIGARRIGSDRGRLVATVLYTALPVPYNALSQGHWAGLIAYAAAPWLISGLCDLGGEAPYTFFLWDAAWPRYLSLGLGLAAAASLAPALLLVVPALGAAFFLASLLVGGTGAGARLLVASLVVPAVAFVALAPWSFTVLHSWSAVLGPMASTGHPLGLSQVFRLQTGPYGAGALGWALVVAAAISIFIGRSWRLVWAARMWVVALAGMAVAFAGSRGWLPVPSLELVLAPAGAALVFAVALGATSVETDLSGYRFGWHQFAPPFGALAGLAATLPLLAWVGGGQWDLPAAGAEQAYAFPAASTSGDYRVLWVGRPGSLPLAAQGSAGNASYAASVDGLPLAAQLWTSPTSRQSAAVGRDVGWAEANRTTELGHLLAPVSVRFIVVPTGGPGTAATVDALSRQVDLVPVGLDPQYQVFENSAWLPVFSVLGGAGASQLAAAAAAGSPWATAGRLQTLDLSSLTALRAGGGGASVLTVPGVLPAEVLYASVPPRSWRAQANGHTLAPRSVGGAATLWALPAGRQAVALSPSGTGAQHLAGAATLALWAIGLSVARARRRTGRGQFLMANLELGSPGADVLEIDWSAVLDGQTVG